jgi:hypothetical protein
MVDGTWMGVDTRVRRNQYGVTGCKGRGLTLAKKARNTACGVI